ncbi:MAG: hypothetical protein BWY51_00793 [Parcubacteria group bacterium ADurb.Bin316]|nr:MAG: hypothetical protein BWY51_00793 [Parcubacteria group bacterium ADurb.Bin316]HOZ56517.1 hypothetical protein [bacterium]
MSEKKYFEKIGSQMPEGTRENMLPNGKVEFDLADVDNEKSMDQRAREEVAIKPRQARETELHTIVKRSPDILRTRQTLSEKQNAIFGSRERNFNKYGLKKESKDRFLNSLARKFKRSVGREVPEDDASDVNI